MIDIVNIISNEFAKEERKRLQEEQKDECYNKVDDFIDFMSQKLSNEEYIKFIHFLDKLVLEDSETEHRLIRFTLEFISAIENFTQK